MNAAAQRAVTLTKAQFAAIRLALDAYDVQGRGYEHRISSSVPGVYQIYRLTPLGPPMQWQALATLKQYFDHSDGYSHVEIQFDPPSGSRVLRNERQYFTELAHAIAIAIETHRGDVPIRVIYRHQEDGRHDHRDYLLRHAPWQRAPGDLYRWTGAQDSEIHFVRQQ